MQAAGAAGDIDNQVHYILAVTYALVCRRKSLQNIVLDAYLSPNSTRASRSTGLPEEIRERIREVTASRNRMQVQAELANLLRRFTVPPQMMPLLQEACRRWGGRGIVLMRQQGHDGLEQFLREADYWMQKFRKRSDRWVRHFLDLFAYECKVAFHTCYANARIGLIPWLREHRGLDELSERFLRFWHNQNQAVEIPRGQTPSGILYPTQHGISTLDRNRRHQQTLSVATERIGPEPIPAAFQGQVLSLHPMSAFFMKDPALCAVAGRFFASDAYEVFQNPGLIRRCSQYWDLGGAILTATHVYRAAVDRQSNRRGTRTGPGAEQVAVHEADDLDLGSVFEDFLVAHRTRCPRCNGRLNFIRHTSLATEDDSVQVEFACAACRRRERRHIAFADLAPWLNGR